MMFQPTARPKLSPEELDAIVSDEARLDATVDAVSDYLSTLLSLEVTGLYGERQPFAEAMRKEVRELEDLHFNMHAYRRMVKMYESVARMHLTYEQLYARTDLYADRPYPLHALAKTEAWNTLVEFARKSVIVREPLRVGALGLVLEERIANEAFTWLQQVDAALCTANSVACVSHRVDGQCRVESICRFLAAGMAQRATLLVEMNSEDDALSTRSIQKVIGGELARCAHPAVLTLESSLRTFHRLSRAGGVLRDEAAALIVLKSDCSDLRELLQAPPEELARLLTPLDVPALCCCLGPKQESAVAVALLKTWAAQHGDALSSAVYTAAMKMRDTFAALVEGRLPKSAFINLVAESPSSIALPNATFLGSDVVLHVKRRGSPLEIRGVDEVALRVTQLCHITIHAVNLGILRAGYIRRGLLHSISFEHMLIARFAAREMRFEDEFTCAPGRSLAHVLFQLSDPSGDYAADIGKAACALSRYSVAELDAIFRSDGGAFDRVARQLSLKTRERVPFKLAATYRGFAADAAGVALPIIARRRAALGLCGSARPLLLNELLMTATRVQGWTPLEGTLRLCLGDLRGAHAALRPVLEALAEAGIMVSTKGGNFKLVYTFDTMQLFELLQSHA